MNSHVQQVKSSKSLLLVALVLLTTLVMFSAGLQARDPLLPVASTESVGMSSERLARFDALAAEYINSGRIAGVVALVMRDGKIVHETIQGKDLDIQDSARQKRWVS
ncbi:MAG: hypothetical protein WBS20_04735 [Lysobacterales bacterium]